MKRCPGNLRGFAKRRPGIRETVPGSPRWDARAIRVRVRNDAWDPRQVRPALQAVYRRAALQSADEFRDDAVHGFGLIRVGVVTRTRNPFDGESGSLVPFSVVSDA